MPIDLFLYSATILPLMLMMRLQRVGRRNDPAYRIVVTDKRTGPKSDKHVDRLGSYNPQRDEINLDADKVKDWLSKGVQPSETVHNLLVSQKIIDGKKINVLPKKSPIIDEEAIKRAEEEAAAKAEAEAAETAAQDTEESPEAEVAEEAKADEVEVEVVADEDDPADHSETAEQDSEEVEKEKSEKAQAQADAEAD
ncbi:30S ribosomal protein S16 [Candidatus Kaiserbacteria bacterium]|nr:30S ribosomal protein S16 [Candidatus Kaiserbacteria bacterium]